MGTDLVTIFVSSLRAIGVYLTMCSVGVFLIRSGLLTSETKKGLAKISCNVTIPALLFCNLLSCTQNWSTAQCTDVTSYIAQGWPLLLLPALNVGVGLMLGHLICLIAHPARNYRKAVMAAVAFGNSTGLPITLIQCVRNGFDSSTELGAVDPTLFLSVYLTVYPVFQWAIGGYLMGTLDASGSATVPVGQEPLLGNSAAPGAANWEKAELNQAAEDTLGEQSSLTADHDEQYHDTGSNSIHPSIDNSAVSSESVSTKGGCCGNLRTIAKAALQPPVVASLLGIAIAFTNNTSFDIRSMLVDTKDRNDDRPLEWWFDGLYKMGQAAVPINMIILGAGLGAFSLEKLRKAPHFVNLLIVVAKMVIMPAFGIGTAMLLHSFHYIGSKVDASFFLVVMLVTATPTANNVASMAELGGQDKEALSSCIFLQYLCAPVLLTLSLTVIVSVSSQY